MSQPANPLSAAEPWNLVADGYAETNMRVFELFAEEARACASPQCRAIADETFNAAGVK